MKTFVLPPLAAVLLATAVLAQDDYLARLPAVGAHYGEVDDALTLLKTVSASQTRKLTSLSHENAALRERLELLEGQIGDCGCKVSDCACICPGVTFSCDWLYWRLHQNNLDYALETSVGPFPQPTTIHSVDMDRNSGVRTRIGYLMASGWEAAFAYTYFCATGRGPRVFKQPGNQVSNTPWFSDPLANGEYVAASFSLSQNIFDLELSHWYALTDSSAARIFGGFRHATMRQRFAVEFEGLGVVSAGTSANGVRIGAEGRWMLRRNLVLSGTLAGCVLCADVDRSTALGNNFPGGEVFVTGFRESYALPVLETAVSASWKRGPLEVAVGYELSAWFNLGYV